MESQKAGSTRAHYIRAPPSLLPSIPLHNYGIGITKITYKTSGGSGGGGGDDDNDSNGFFSLYRSCRYI
jgi:hypothetical protein